MTDDALDDRIRELAHEVDLLEALPDPGFALPTLLRLHAEDLLDRYDNAADPADFDRAIVVLLRATEALGGAHEHLPACHFWLTQTYAARARRDDAVADYDHAIFWTEHLHGQKADDDPDRDGLAVELLDLVWDRSWAFRYILFPGTAEALADAGQLVTRLAAVTVSGHDPIAERYVRLMRGAAHLECCTTDRVHLDTGITVVSAALAELSADEPDVAVSDWVSDGRLALVGALLGAAQFLRFDLDGKPDDLDQSIGAARTALARVSDDPPPLVLSCLAQGLRKRWDTRGNPDDLDAAIDAWAALRAVSDDDSMALEHAELLTERAERTGDPDDRRAAATLFVHAAKLATEEPAMFWWRAGEAHTALWRLTGERDALDTAAVLLDRAIAVDPVPGDDLLSLHCDRLAVERLRDDAGLLPRAPLADAGRSAYRDLVNAARRAFDSSPHAEAQARATLAAALGLAEMSLVPHDGGAYDVDRIREMATLGATAHDVDPKWQTAMEVMLGTVDTIAGLTSEAGAVDAVARYTRLLASDVTDDLRPTLRWLLSLAMSFRSGMTGDLQTREISHQGLTGLSSEPADVGELFARLLAPLQNSDAAAVSALASRARPMLDAVPDTHPDIYLVRFIRVFATFADPWESPLLPLPPLADPAPGHSGSIGRLTASATVGALIVQAAARDDVDLLTEVTTRADEIFAAAPQDEPRLRHGSAAHAGMGYLELARRGVRTAEFAGRAVERYTVALGLADDRHDKLAAIVTTNCAEAIRLTAAPDLRRSRELGMAVMRIHAWQVFIQSGTVHALTAARAAAGDARTFAGWCVRDGAHDDLVGILDAGRALVLRASSGSRSVAEQLDLRGRSDLAAEWRATGGLGRSLPTGLPLAVGGDDASAVPDELRLKVLRALGGERDVIGLRPVTVAEITAALVATGTDALVHLIAGADAEPGRAVIVAADGALAVLDLPGLDATAVRGHVRGPGMARDAAAVGDAPATDLETLCEWAWTAAMDDVLGRTARLVQGRTPRLVLLPFGLLGAVPWHAARVAAGDGYRYALDEAVISYSPSARMFCDGGAWAPGPVRSSLVVGDPRGDLAFADVEARAIHRRFYPEGTYVGRTTGPDDVLRWIGATPAGPSVLHFACHAALDADRPTEAHLVLSGGQRLSAGRLLESSRSAALELEQVFLAACTTGVTGSDHDEVLSLATSFLAAGARTVFGSLWPVPDTETSLLMFMVHRHLRVDGLRPADALHRAQLWMLAPARAVPADLPAELREQCVEGTVFPPLAWAGFTHYGR